VPVSAPPDGGRPAELRPDGARSDPIPAQELPATSGG
jgi:hypothetical protein